jgi:hypothetical protein
MPHGQKLLGIGWVYTEKFNGRYRPRTVAKGSDDQKAKFINLPGSKTLNRKEHKFISPHILKLQ